MKYQPPHPVKDLPQTGQPGIAFIMQAGDDKGTVGMNAGPENGGTEQIGDKEKKTVVALLLNLVNQGRAPDHVLKEQPFLFPGKPGPGHNLPVEAVEELPVSRTDRKPFNRDAVDLVLSSRIIIMGPIPLKVLEAGCPDLHRFPPLPEILHGPAGFRFSPSRDVGAIPGTDENGFHALSNDCFRKSKIANIGHRITKVEGFTDFMILNFLFDFRTYLYPSTA
jgi:hypothetical protein